MSRRMTRPVFTIAALVMASALGAAAPQPPRQQPAAAPSHKHYAAATEPDRPNQAGQIAPRLQNVGKYVFPVSTKSPRAQLFINQGIKTSRELHHRPARRPGRKSQPHLADVEVARSQAQRIRD